MNKYIADLSTINENKSHPIVSVGDTVKIVSYLELPKVSGDDKKRGKERIQAYEGVVISKHGQNQAKISTTITVRKMFQGGGIEKVFILNSPWVKSIEVI